MVSRGVVKGRLQGRGWHSIELQDGFTEQASAGMLAGKRDRRFDSPRGSEGKEIKKKGGDLVAVNRRIFRGWNSRS